MLTNTGTDEYKSLHRADFLDVLLAHTPATHRTHFGKRLASYEETGAGVALAFADGARATCDLLVGADGIHSAVRTQLYERMAARAEARSESPARVQRLRASHRPIWTGQIAWRCLIPRERLEKAYPGHPSLDDPVYVSAPRAAPRSMR